jgi:hypothetical protein
MKRVTREQANAERCDCAMAQYTARLWDVDVGGCPHTRYHIPIFGPMPKLEAFDNIETVEILEDHKAWRKKNADVTPRDLTPMEEEEAPAGARVHDRLLRLAGILEGVDKKHFRAGTSPNAKFLQDRCREDIASDLRELLTRMRARNLAGEDEKGYRCFCNQCIITAAGRTSHEGQAPGLDAYAAFLGCSFGA